MTSPATIDFLVQLSRDFNDIVVENLSKSMRTSLSSPGALTSAERKMLHRQIIHTVIGKKIYRYQCFGSGSRLDPDLGVFWKQIRNPDPVPGA